MKRRGLRPALTAGAIGLAIVAGLVAFNWGVVRDHVEAWWFQVTRETLKISPPNQGPRQWVRCPWLFQLLADTGNRLVIFDAALNDRRDDVYWNSPWEEVMTRLRRNGFRILEQRFPRPAYVVVGYPPKEPTWRGYRLSTLNVKAQ